MSGWKRPLLIVLATAPIGITAFVIIFVAQSEMAFDEASCPYEEREVREVVAEAAVREESRSCADGVEEHRWVLLRDGDTPLELGRRRLETEFYDGYTWTAEEQNGRVRVEIRNPGQPPRVFREPAPDAAR